MTDSTVILCTGGIGSGKSCVVRALEALGVPAFDCDSAAKRLYDEDAGLLAGIAEAVGHDVVRDGKLDRRVLASRVFGDPESLRKVECLVHPAVIRNFNCWKAVQTSSVVAVESAIMLQKPALAAVPDYVLEVTAPDEIRVVRVMERDGCSAEEVRSRIAAQCGKPLRCADFTVETDDRHDVLPVLTDILEKLKNGKD